MDFSLGMGAHAALRTAIGTLNRPYTTPFLANHAQTLIAAGWNWQVARNLMHHLVANVAVAADFNEAIALAAGLIGPPNAWGYQPVQYCITAFLANRNLQTGAQWALVGRAVGQNQHANATAFARLANWNHASIVLLAQGFAGANPNGFTAQQWLTIASQFNANQAAEANAFARLNGWNVASVSQLIRAFNGNAHGLTELQWATIASRCAANAHADAAAFAGIAGWTFAAKDQLAQNRAAGNPNNFSAAEWVQLAGLCGANQHAGTTALVRINGWTALAVRQLAQAFAAGNPNNLTYAEWAGIAAVLGADEHAQTAEFARTAGWNAASVIQLATAFHAANPNNHTAAQWSAQAAAGAVNQHAQAVVFSRLRGRGNTAWNHASTLQLIQNRTAVGGNPRGFSPAQWEGIVNVLPANAHADVTTFAQIAAWAHVDLITLATLFGADAYHQTAADWLAHASRYGGGAWANLTATAMRYRGRSWKDTVRINRAGAPQEVWQLQGAADGLVYRRAGVINPHITLHNLGADDPDNWYRDGNFHVVTGVGRPYEYNRTAYTPYSNAAPAPTADVTAIATSFCADVLP